MIRIALVGEIGSGKTFVSKQFKFPLFNADKEVDKIYKNNKDCFKKINRKFPDHIKKPPILKSDLKKILNKKNIKIISRIVHPYVRINLNKFLKKNRLKKYVVLDIPLIIENKLFKKKDILIYVKTPQKVITQRLKKRGTKSKKTIKFLKSQQAKNNKKIKLSNFTIDNRFGKKNVIKQIREIIKKIND